MHYGKPEPIILLTLLTILLTVSSCSPESEKAGTSVNTSSTVQVDAGTEESLTGSTQTADTTGEDPYADLKEEYKGDPEGLVAAMYARKFDVSIEEAQYRLDLQNKIGPLGAELDAAGLEGYAGFWIQHEPHYCLVVAFAGDNGEELITPYREKYPEFADLLEVHKVQYTQAELLAAQQEANYTLQELGLFFSSSTDIVNNRVEIYVTDGELFYNTLGESGMTLPECVLPVITYEPSEGVPEGLIPDTSVHFPQLKTASSEYMLAINVGILELVDGYLRVNDEIIIWQPDYFVHNNDGVIEIWDKDGIVVGRVGEEIFMGGGSVPTLNGINPQLRKSLPEDTEGTFFLQGGGTRLNLNFNSDLFYLDVVTGHDSKAYVLRRKPLLDDTARQEITLTGTLIAGYNGNISRYPHIRVDAKPEEHKGIVDYTVFWPDDYSARIKNGVFEITDGSGKVVIRDGDKKEISGKVIYGYNERLSDELPGGWSSPYLIVERIE